MKHTKKMQLVEYSEPNTQPPSVHANRHNVRDEDYPAPSPLQNLDNEMSLILSDATTDIEQKWALYHQALQRYLGFIKRMRQGTSINNEDISDATDAQQSIDEDSPQNWQLPQPQTQQQVETATKPLQRQRAWKGTAFTKKMITRKNSEPWDLVSPLHTPKRKTNNQRRHPYKDRYRKGNYDNARAEVSNRRNNDLDIRRGLPGDIDDHLSTIHATHHPFLSSNMVDLPQNVGNEDDYIQTTANMRTRISPNRARFAEKSYEGLVKPCSVRLSSSIDGWSDSNIQK